MSTQDAGPPTLTEHNNTNTAIKNEEQELPAAAKEGQQVLPTTNLNPAQAPAATTNNIGDPVVPQYPVGTIIDCPHPIDVLMPISGYQLWAGNRRYRTLVEMLRPKFRQCNATDQARLALEIVRTIQREGGRFLQAIESPASPNESVNGIVRTTVWKILPETDVLVNLGESLRDEHGHARKRRRQERKERRRERRRLRRAARTAEIATTAAINNTDDIPEAATMDALKGLYYIPGAATGTSIAGSQYRPVTSITHGGRDDDTLSSTSTSSSDIESLPLSPPHSKKTKATGARRVTKGPPGAAAHANTTDNLVRLQKKEPKLNFHYKAKPSRSSKAAMEKEGESELPKGVTVRPSGKWQAQTYFAGQSRYVGVYDSSRMAARAYVVVQDYLRKFRENRSLTKDSPKEELARIFATARKEADDAVAELRRSDEATGNKNTTTAEVVGAGNNADHADV